MKVIPIEVFTSSTRASLVVTASRVLVVDGQDRPLLEVHVGVKSLRGSILEAYDWALENGYTLAVANFEGPIPVESLVEP